MAKRGGAHQSGGGWTNDREKPFEGEFPEEVEKRLQGYDPKKGELDLALCKITCEMMPGLIERLMRLAGLHTLDIRGNQLTDAGAEAIAKLTGLQTLDIISNHLTDAGAEAIATLTSLHTLYICLNRITGTGAKAIAKLRGLRELGIRSNKLADTGAGAIANLTDLRSLLISGNKLTDAGAKAIAKVTDLRILDLTDNELTAAGAEAIAGLTRLHTLGIRDNKVTDAGARAISKLIGLHTLDICRCQLTDAGAKAIAELTRLHYLCIDGNQLTDAGAKSIAKLSGLHTLYIGWNQLTDAGAEALAILTGLHTLDIRGNKIVNPNIIIDLCDRILRREPTSKDESFEDRSYIFVAQNPLCWPETTEEISETVLEENNPAKLKASLEALLDQGSVTTGVAGIAMAGLTTHGKTHLSRWIAAEESEYPALRVPIDENKRTWGYDRYAFGLSAVDHGQADIGDLSLTILDVGGHREQLSAVSNLIYSNVRRSIFVLCVHAKKDFKRGNLGEYYLKLIESLAANRESYERGHRIFVKELVMRGERIPVVIVITHAARAGEILLDEKALRQQFKLLDIVVFDPWDISMGSERIQLLRSTIARQVGKLKALRKGTLKSFSPVRDAIADRFELDEYIDAEIAPATHSITMEEFRKICVENGETQRDFQDILAKELAAIGYVAIVGPTTELEDDRRLLNPRFVNHYLFSKVLGHVDTRRQNGFMRNDWFEALTFGVSRTNKDELRKLMEECLATFKWEWAGFPEGVFVPDLAPIREDDQHPKWDNAVIEGEFVVSGFLGEDAFFRFVSRRHTDLEPVGITNDPEAGRQIILLYRNECIVRDDSCKALVTIDLVDSIVRIAVRGPDYKKAHSFAERVKGWITNEVRGTLQGEWQEALFERLWLELKGAGSRGKRTLAVVKRIYLFPQEKRDQSWTQKDMSFWLPEEECEDREKVRDSVKWLVRKQILVENSEVGYRLTNHTGVPFISWLACKYQP